MNKVDTTKFMELLKSELSIEEFSGVPCSNLKYLINYAKNKDMYTEVPNEGEAVAYSAGAYIGGKRVAIMMQNSGISNAMSALSSLSGIFEIPQVFIIGHRGIDGPGTDEPQHNITGKVCPQWLMSCNVNVLPFRVLDTEDDDFNRLEDMIDFAKEVLEVEKQSIAFLVDKGRFSEAKLEDSDSLFSHVDTSRDQVLELVDKYRDKDTVVITTTGFTSRAMYDRFSNPQNFYMVGSMGEALAIGVGLAKFRPDLKVVVIDGDGALMMRPQTVILDKQLNLENLFYIVLDNGSYESTGGQHTRIDQKFPYDISNMLAGLYNIQYRSDISGYSTLDELNWRLNEFFSNNTNYYPYTVLKVNSENNDNNLGRPKESMPELLEGLMKSING